MFISTFSETPFCTIFPFSVAVLPPVLAVLEAFDIVFFADGDVAVVFGEEVTRFVVVVVVVVELAADRRLLTLLPMLVRDMEICLFAVSFTCLSIIGGFPVDARVFVAFPTAGAVFGLAVLVVEVVVAALLDFAAGLGLPAAPVDAGFGFGVGADPVDVRPVGALTVVVFVGGGVLLGGFAAAGLLRDFTSPFAVGFLSATGGLEDAAVVGFGLET